MEELLIVSYVSKNKDNLSVLCVSKRSDNNPDTIKILKTIKGDEADYIYELLTKRNAKSSNPVPIKVNHKDGMTTHGYLDKSRQLIFDSYITCELAKFFGSTWEEDNERH